MKLNIIRKKASSLRELSREQVQIPEVSTLEELLGEFDLEIHDRVPTGFVCDCSKERVARAIVSIGSKDIREMIQEGKPVEANCHFCNKNYVFSIEDLKELLRQSKR